MADRKRGRDHAPDNVDAKGDYVVGKNRPPESGKFRAGDGRPRGQRKKGTRNLATDLREELETKVNVSIGGKQVKVTLQRAILMRLSDNASRGQNPAIAMALDYQQRIIEPILAEEQRKAEKEEAPDYKRLDLTEMLALEYLMCKAYNQPYHDVPPTIIDNRPYYSVRSKGAEPDGTK